MSIPIIYVFSSTKGEYVNGEQRETELYTAAVTEDGTELFRTHGKLDPMVLTFRPEDHTLLHSACVTYSPGGYELQWREPPANVYPQEDAASELEKQDAGTELPPAGESADGVAETVSEPVEGGSGGSRPAGADVEPADVAEAAVAVEDAVDGSLSGGPAVESVEPASEPVEPVVEVPVKESK